MVQDKLLADLVQYQELFEVTDATRTTLKSLLEGQPIAKKAVVYIYLISLDDFISKG